MRFFTKIKHCDDVTTLDDDDLICYCIEVDKKSIVEAIRNGATDLKTIKEKTSACTGQECAEKNPNGRCCSKEIRQLIDLHGKRV